MHSIAISPQLASAYALSLSLSARIVWTLSIALSARFERLPTKEFVASVLNTAELHRTVCPTISLIVFADSDV